MNDHELNSELKQFYEKAELPEGLLNRLHELESVGAVLSPSEESARDNVGSRNYFSSLKTFLLIAASVVLAFTAGYLTRQNLKDTDEAKPLITKTSSPAVKTSPVNQPVLPRVVAVRYYADYCPRCPKVAPIYQDLLEQYGDTPLMFLTLDVSSKNKSCQSRQLMRLLDIEWIQNQNLETGSILLIDREKSEILAIVKQKDEQLTFEAALTDCLDSVK